MNLFDAGGTKKAGVSFGAATTTSPLKTFDNAAGLNGVAITTLSASGINGAFSITDGSFTAIGSPGTLGASAAPVVTIAATDADADETGGNPGRFRISRTGSTVGVLTVNYTIAAGAGQATGADYTPALTSPATIASGQAFVDVTVIPVDDIVFEGPETVILTLGDSGSYDVGTAATATVTITDNELPETTLNSWPTESPTSSRDAQFAFSGNDAGAGLLRFECSLGTAPFGPCSSPTGYPGLGDGVHTFNVRAVYGDNPAIVEATPASFTWMIDATPPVVTCAATPNRLWPANHKVIDVTVVVNVSDATSGPAGFTRRCWCHTIKASSPRSSVRPTGSADDAIILRWRQSKRLCSPLRCGIAWRMPPS